MALGITNQNFQESQVSSLQNLNVKFCKMGQFSSNSKHKHVAYQMKGNEE